MKALFTAGLVSALTCAGLLFATSRPVQAETPVPIANPVKVKPDHKTPVPGPDYCFNLYAECLAGGGDPQTCYFNYDECLEWLQLGGGQGN